MSGHLGAEQDRPRTVAIRVNGPGDAAVHLDGVDVTNHLTGLTLNAGRDPFPVVTLTVAATAGVEFDGLARVVVAQPGIDVEAVAGFLAAMDPATVQRHALNRAGVGPTAGTEAILSVLIDLATGKVL